MDSRPVLFFHIPKCGGTSVVSSVNSRLAWDEAVGIYDTDPVTVSERVSAIARMPRTRFLYGHISPTGIAGEVPVRRAILLRDPVERLQSHFCHAFRRQLFDEAQFRFFTKPRYFGRREFGAADLGDWIEHFRADNVITRWLADKKAGNLDNSDINRAEAVLADMDAVGFTDRLDEFLVRLGELIGGAQLSPARENCSDRSVLDVRPADLDGLAARYLAHDMRIVGEARAAALQPRPAPYWAQPMAESSSRMGQIGRRLLRLARYRNAAEIWAYGRHWLGTGLRVARLWRLQLAPKVFGRRDGPARVLITRGSGR